MFTGRQRKPFFWKICFSKEQQWSQKKVHLAKHFSFFLSFMSWLHRTTKTGREYARNTEHSWALYDQLICTPSLTPKKQALNLAGKGTLAKNAKRIWILCLSLSPVSTTALTILNPISWTRNLSQVPQEEQDSQLSFAAGRTATNTNVTTNS